MENQENVTELLRPRLLNHIYEKFERARQVKQNIEQIMLENLRYFQNKYPPDQLVKMKEIGHPESFLPLINVKVRALKSWLSDIYFSEPDEPPFDIEPTPLPTLTEELKKKYLNKYANELLSRMQTIDDSLFNQLRNVKKEIEEELKRDLKELANEEKKRIADQLLEGDFYKALDELFLDIAIFPTAIMKVCYKQVKQISPTREIVKKVIPYFRRVSPFDIYPSPDCADFSDYVIEILHYTPEDLQELMELEGFNKDAIKHIIALYKDGYQEIFTQGERRTLENKSLLPKTIDVLEFWGHVKGEYLTEFFENIDSEKYYFINAWICSDYILKLTLDPHPLGLKPYFKVSFVDIPDSFWGMSLVSILKDLQNIINSLNRAIIVNSALSSGPIIERNIDRIPPDEPKQIMPWMIFDSHDLGMSNAPAYRFYQPTLTANALITTMQVYMQMAHELSGIPPYAHAVPSGSGALRTSSGLRMLIETSSRGIKDVVRNIDKSIIEPIVSYLYYENLLLYYEQGMPVPDLNIRAKGTQSLLSKQMHLEKLLQLLQIINNPVDMQLVGLENRKQIIEDIIRILGVDITLSDTTIAQPVIPQPTPPPKKQKEYEDLANLLQAQEIQQTLDNIQGGE